MLAMSATASETLAMAFRLPKAMPMLRCLVGVTRMCSIVRINAKSETPSHNSHVWGCEVAKMSSVATLAACSSALIMSDVRAEKRDGMECSPRLRSKSASCKA